LEQYGLVRFILISSLFLIGQGCKVHPLKQANPDVVKMIELQLSAFGVESDGFPSIKAIIDLQSDTSYCMVSYYDPKFRDTTYRLTKATMDSIRYFVAHGDIHRLKKKYAVSMSDQPTSTTVFYFSDKEIEISDYGLEGPFPLKELYGLVYKLNINFR
jgi:hypothetical protein